MKKKFVVFSICMLLITTILPFNASAGDEENPEVKDRIEDVMGFIPYSTCLSIDMVSTWFSEDDSNPENLYISLKTIDLDAKTKTKARPLFSIFTFLLQRLSRHIFKINTKEYQMVYAVAWRVNNKYYTTVVHGYSDRIGDFIVGKSPDGDDEIDHWYYCDGTFDKENNIITWVIPKDLIDNPSQGSLVTYISPHTHLRQVDEQGRPTMDYAKDVSLDALVIKDYVIQY
jgi:hypothetical protein